MLDYAANGVEYWDIDRLRQAATETAQKQDKSLDEEVLRLIGGTGDPAAIDAFSHQVASNLKKHRVRLIFVSDSAPRELRRLVEFLNEEMANVEVLAVEVKQFQGSHPGAVQALVPRVLGATETARQVKEPGTRKPTLTPEEFLARCNPEAREFFARVVDLPTKRD